MSQRLKTNYHSIFLIMEKQESIQKDINTSFLYETVDNVNLMLPLLPSRY